MTTHRWVTFQNVPDYLQTGWLALPTLEGTGHGLYSAHCIWLCDCKVPSPLNPALDGAATIESREDGG